MAASLDTRANPQHHTFARDSQQNKRSFSSPALALASLRSSFSQGTVRDEQQQSQRKSYSTTSSTTPISTQSTLNHNVDSGIDLQNIPRTFDSRLSNDSKSTRNTVSHHPKSSLPQLQIPFHQNGGTKMNKDAPIKSDTKGDEEDSYFGDILDKYCHSDEDPTSPSTASPTSPFSTSNRWADLKSPQPPTPPVTSKRHQQNQYSAVTPQSRATPLRNSSTTQSDASPSTAPSAMLAASARFNAYLQSTSDRGSRDSLQLHGSNSIPSSNRSSPTASGVRTYSKRPAPIPGSSANASPRTSGVPTVFPQSSNYPKSEQQKENQRRVSAQPNNNSGSFPAVVEEAMRRNKSASVSSFSSSSSGSINPYAESAITTRERGSSGQSLLNYLSSTPRDHSSQQQHLYNQGQKGSTSPRSPGNEDQPFYQHQQQQQQWFLQQQQQQQQRHGQRQHIMGSPHQQIVQSSQQQSSSYNSSPLTPSEMLSRRFDLGARTSSQSSIASVSKYSATPNGVKSALTKRPSTRSRTKDPNDSRKVIFGDMITIVTVQRTESPPPVDVKKNKKKFKKSSKTGPHPDPEYNAEYFNAPFTPEPAEVLITQAPWIGNPNYDEEKQNSSFYYDDYEYEEEEYEHESQDFQSGPYDDDEDDDEDDEDDDEDEFNTGNRTWGNGVAAGDISPKKKGGIFKFKRAVNRLLRN
ncbi:hypothetical protein BGZ46_002232 [Entomortierella lignicola]|nr:hypothetical protein BGZ46_002232 [Entomortierella lignicola]